MPFTLLEKECGPKCKSRKHVLEIISIIAQANLRQFEAYASLCHNWVRHSDVFGRTALHIAASCGKTEILEWLLEEKKLDVTVKDLESGYTALHRAMYYGQLTCARLLTQFNSDVHVRDVEGLTPLDLAMLDRPPNVTYTVREPNEVYTWGENNNSTHGHPSPHKRTSPEAVELFKKSGISIKQIVLCKYHSVFLTQSGQVYTCGHGQGGRLGHEDQHTVLVPRLLKSVEEFTCLEIAAATDHTVLRMEGGVVFTFGINAYHQLGQTPFVDTSPVPKQMNLKPLKGKTVSGVCVGRFHTIVWTPDSVFTVGLNAGQLGHQKGEKFQSQLRQVSSLRHTDIGIATVACSDAATICLTTKGDVYVLHEYQCRKIVSKGQDIDQVVVNGGNLDHSTGLGILSEKGGQELQVMVKNETGQLLLWRSNDPCIKRCQFSLKRQLSVSDIAMTSSSLIFSTNRGEAFIGYFSNKKTAATPREPESKHGKELVKEFGEGFSQTRLLDLLLKEPVEEIQVRRVPVVHRAVLVAADRKGKNFAVLQALPNGSMSELPSVDASEINEQFGQLLKEVDTEDHIHDAIIQVGDRQWPVHKYIIAMRSDHFRNMVSANLSTPKGEKLVLKVDHVRPDIMDQLITFIYTDMCDFLQLGFKVKTDSSSEKETKRQTPSPKLDQLSDEFDELIPTKGLSAFQVQEKRNAQKSKKKEANKGQNEGKDNVHVSQNPVRMLQDAARKFGVKGLSKRLDAVKCSNDIIVSQGKNLAKPKVKFDRTKLPELYDVTITTEDGQELHCHKCVLVSRLEYFYSMLATGWVETFNTTTLNLPVAAEVLEILVDYLYTDEAPLLRDCTNEELLCNVLVVSDQLLAWRLKEMCEVALANIIAFKNVSELLEFSTIYNAHQLKASCQQFICLNLSAMVEGRYLDVLSQDTLDELTDYYRYTVPSMMYRVYTPDEEGPSESYLDELVAEFDSLDTDSHHQHYGESGSAKKSKQQRKRNKSRKQSTSEDVERLDGGGKGGLAPRIDRNISVSSDLSTRSEDDFMAVVDEINKQVEEDEKKHQAETRRAKETIKKGQVETSAPVAIQTKSGVPTQPEDIPRWSSNFQTLSWASASKRLESSSDVTVESPAQSPVSSSILATSPTSLREIMSQQSQSTEKKKMTYSSRVSWKDVKKQQHKETKEKQQKTFSTETSDQPVPSPSPKAAWGSVETAVKSFRDLMIEEKGATTPAVTVPSPAAGQRGRVSGSDVGTQGKSPPSGSSSWGLPMVGGRNIPRTSPVNATVPASPPSGADNPWQRRAAAAAATASSPPAQSPITALDFSAILKDEKEKSDTLARTTQKPLALIQLEEQAMNELLSHYNAGKDVDRYITVERVSKEMAAPLWRRERNPNAIDHL